MNGRRRGERDQFAFMRRVWMLVGAWLLFAALPASGQTPDAPSTTKAQVAEQPPTSEQQLPVSWLYGAYIPKDAPLEPLSNADRWRLYVRMSFTTPGIWIKTGFFTARDQITDSPEGWSQDGEGLANRLGNRYAQFLIQNSFTAVGNAVAGWEVRYDRCRNCTSVGQRVKHTIVRNFVTYADDEKSLRPQVFLYAAAFGGAALSSFWQPYRPNPVVKGYQGVATQAWVGVLTNMVGEFTPDVKRAIRRDKKKKLTDSSQPQP